MSLNCCYDKLNIGNNILNANSSVNINGSINILSGNYISFGSNYQDTSYGLRDNNGVIEYKNSNGLWKNISYIEDNTIALTKLTGLVSTNTIANVVLDNGSLGKVSNNVITDNTISGVKIAENTINPTKILNYPTDGTKYLSGDGTWKVVSVSNQDAATISYVDNSLTYSLDSSYTGSLSGISCKILITCNDGNMNDTYKNNIISNFNRVITNYGGSTSNIIITIQNYQGDTNINNYDSQYDVILYFNNIDMTATTKNVKTVLNQYYNAGKGVVLSMSSIGSTYIDSIISSASANIDDNTGIYNQSSTHSILYNVSSLTPYGRFTTFTPINGSTGIGTYPYTNAIIYLDNTNGKGRRVDITAWLSKALNLDTLNNNMVLATLQACLWAGKKIAILTSTKLNLSNPILPSLQVYNTASSNYDVVNKSYLTNYTTKYSKTLTSTDFYIYVDITKPHIYSLYYITNSYYSNTNTGTLYIYPYNSTYFTYRLIYNATVVNNTLVNNSTSYAYTGLMTISMVSGMLKILPAYNYLICQEM